MIPDYGILLYNNYADINDYWSNFYVQGINARKEIFPSWTRMGKKARSENKHAPQVHSLGHSGVTLEIEDSIYTFNTTMVYIGNELTDEFYKLGVGLEDKQLVIDSLFEKCLLGK